MSKQSRTAPPAPAPPPLRVALIVSRYNATITDALERGALTEAETRGGGGIEVDVFSAPGSFELVALATAAIAGEEYDGVCCLGCIIKGETSHDEFIAHAVAQGLTALTVSSGVPIAFGVLTTNTAAQAKARAGVGGGSEGNKGQEAMSALLDTISESARAFAGMPANASTHARPDKAERKLKAR